ncbi:hypothetical protein Kpol_1048p68 [Vanderwaltozyma polyspora DSM 70294]|uniref:Uncharacterized protein n=1 Tax=Vanderwaltozyma polyspora (strain ATCC 22028 / DSM 70294 / BCRC 21397 / CBS 2163 / NBRC 10782 / NRRL Y-8283 / UCD 57-17) TaxID=436907 RepID=A7TGN0_VANPO|nr:uncharacterized protein Kpol_1048p68 [Vanderwaltozyma polyspora DSM 70294]EDO18637.1 hypothetical protein Kpol_1048p68 [Vanderwaltozyma polyspora DSM 70294]
MHSIAYNISEIRTKISRRFGGHISLNSSFVEDLEAGLSSRNFDIISQNSKDVRSGLDENTKNEIKKIMDSENLSFDKARLQYTERQFGKNGIAPDGTPMDPKAVTFGK